MNDSSKLKQLFINWGFTPEGLKTGERGEYLLLLQGIAVLGFVLLPVYPISRLLPQFSSFNLAIWGGAAILGLIAAIFITKGLWDLGQNLTPLPYPKPDGELVQTGIYRFVRHPLYSGLIFAALAWTLFAGSLSHLFGTIFLGIILDVKSRREEVWLKEKYPDYTSYQQQVKKFIPGIY